MTSENPTFAKLESVADEHGVVEAIEFLIAHFRQHDDHHQLFEALKMKIRYELGLPLLYGETPDQVNEQQQRLLEDGLLEACREVGTELLKNGRLQEGWMYLQPVGDRELVKKLIEDTKVTDENTDALIEIALGQGAAPEFGYELLLENFGTCNAITTFDTQIVRLDRPVQKQLAGMLVNHLYNELVTNVGKHIESQEKKLPKSKSLAELTSHRAWLTADGAHQIDTTHLASIMRIGRIVDDSRQLQQLVELARYGQKLDEDFHYAGSPPFEDTYHDHVIFYEALTGKNVDTAVAHFEAKIKSTDREQHGLVAVETLVDLLSRTGQRERAMKVSIERLLGEQDLTGLAPNAFEIAADSADYQRLMAHYRDRNDLLGFSIGLLKLKSGQ